MKNSKTAIRELTSRYRSVLLKCFAIAMAIGLSSGAMAALNDKVEGDNGDSYIFNETDGGGALFIGDNGVNSFVGVHDGISGNIEANAQLYAIDKDTKEGSRLNVTDEGIYYAVGNTADINTADNEIATAGSVASAIKSELVKESLTGTASILTGTDGGGAMFAGNNGITSYVGVNDRTDGVAVDAQIYAKDSTGQGARLNVTTEGIYYAVGNTWQINTEANEIATAGTVKAAIDELVGKPSTETEEATGLNAIFEEKQAWVDKTLGIKSADTDAVKDALTGKIAGNETTFTGAINTLDAAIVKETKRATEEEGKIRAEMAAGFTRLDHKIDQLENKMEKGLAASAALAGLVPLSNEHKTQLSAAMGGYGSNAAVAVGAFHYLNDKTLLNLGGAYGGNTDFSYKVGVTFGF